MRSIHRLSSLSVNNEVKPGYYADGGGLYLQISQFGTKSWVFRFVLHKKREMGLGPIHDIPLKKARETAHECRLLVREGIDPITYRKERRAQAQNKSATFMTFKDCAEKYIRNNQAGWSNPKHAKQWTSTLETYAYPVIGPLPVSSVETTHIMEILEPIWSKKSETAKRVRGRIESVLDAARVAKLRTGENPARWKGHLDKLLPASSKVAKVIHHPSLPHAEISNFIAALRAQDNISSSALEFLILTAARTNEVIDATFDEFDLDKGVWIIPAARMKAKREHRVPLSARAIQIIKAMVKVCQNDHVFPGQRGKGLSNMALLQLLKRMKQTGITVHGFRSTFRDWAAEQTVYPSDVVEMALAHSVGNQVQQAYFRTDLFEKRAALMRDWAGYLEKRKDRE